MRFGVRAVALLILLALPAPLLAAAPTYSIEEAVALAQVQNPEIAIARKKIQAARGGLVEARSGFLPSVVSTGVLDKREHQSETRLRDEDYNASLRVVQNLYTGGAVTSQVAIARLNIDKQEYEFQEIANRVAMDVRIGFNELLLNRAKIRVREDSVRVLEEELKTQHRQQIERSARRSCAGQRTAGVDQRADPAKKFLPATRRTFRDRFSARFRASAL
jgi:outer membrane protein TolC